jgi:hypothetical protein
LDFKKKTEIKKAKPNLHIDYGIANLIAEYAVFKRKHSKPNLDSSFLDDYEAKVLNKNEVEKKVGTTVESSLSTLDTPLSIMVKP